MGRRRVGMAVGEHRQRLRSSGADSRIPGALSTNFVSWQQEREGLDPPMESNIGRLGGAIMRRPGPRSAVAIGLVASLVLALLVASSMPPATGQPTKPEANRFAPSGVVDVDPDAAATAGATARAQAATADAAGGGSVPAPSGSGTSGCNDIDDGNVRVNQECTNQSEAAFLGRGQGQNETALAVNPKNPRHLLAGQNDYRRGDGACGADWSYDGGPSLGQRAGPSQLHRARSPRLAPAPACSSA